VALAAAVLLAGAWAAQRHYLDHRYVDDGLAIAAIHEHFRDVRDADVAVFGTDETLPMFGLDLSNRVRRGDDPPPDLGDDACRGWRRSLRGRYDFVVLTRFGFSFYLAPPEEVVAGDPAATEVRRDGDAVVYRIDGALDPEACP
jgi:hypothetical protein